MKYRTKVTVVSNGKIYPPGYILPEDISNTDMAFLKEKQFVELVDASMGLFNETDGLMDPEDESESGFEGFGGMQIQPLKSSDEIRKIRSKKEVAAYADSIGFDFGENFEERSLKDLQADVIDFQEEQMESGEEEE